MFDWLRYKLELWSIVREQRRIDRLFERNAKEYAEAQKNEGYEGKVPKSIQRLNRDILTLEAKALLAETIYLYSLAHKLRVPTPNDSKPELWTEGLFAGSKRLTDEAFADFRATVRKEQNERWQYWELRLKVLGVVLTGLTGAIGALIGLVATFKR
jgi:hypothetical protein